MVPVKIDAKVAPKSSFIENLETKVPALWLIDLIEPDMKCYLIAEKFN